MSDKSTDQPNGELSISDFARTIGRRPSSVSERKNALGIDGKRVKIGWVTYCLLTVDEQKRIAESYKRPPLKKKHNPDKTEEWIITDETYSSYWGTLVRCPSCTKKEGTAVNFLSNGRRMVCASCGEVRKIK